MTLSDQFLHDIQSFQQAFEKEEGYFEDDIRVFDYFKKYPANTDENEVILKISATPHGDLDKLIKSRSSVAKHIISLQIDGPLRDKDEKIVNAIARFEHDYQHYNLYSFATRYCNYHFPDEYPIYDTHAEKILTAYFAKIKEQKLDEQEITYFPLFKKRMLILRDELKLEKYNFKELDKFIWINEDAILKSM